MSGEPRGRRRSASGATPTARDELGAEPALAWRGGLPVPADRVWERHATTPVWRRWAAVGLAAVVSGPFALLAAVYENSTASVGFVLLVVVIGPLIEESVKGAGAVALAELRPWLVPAAWVLPCIAVVSGLTFAAIENWWYLHVLIDDPSPQIVLWRWLLGPLVHGTGSFIVGLGAARMWQRARRRRQAPTFDDVRGFVVAAAVLHGTFNLTALLLEATGRLE